jgi:hypothetical protein
MPVSITLNLPPDVESRVKDEAARQSMPVEEYLLTVVSRSVPSNNNGQRERSLALLASVEEIGDETEQHETFEYLKAAIDEDRLSDRNRFA